VEDVCDGASFTLGRASAVALYLPELYFAT
jgi:hypothetical protein